MLQPLVVVVHSDREVPFGGILADHVIIERRKDFRRRRNFAFLAANDAGLRFFADDVIAQLNAFITDEYSWPCDQLADFMLRLAAEAAIKGTLAVSSAQFRHS